MITSKDARYEMSQTKKVINNDNASVVDKIKATYKLVSVLLKVVLTNRRNVVKVMEKLEVEKDVVIVPQKTDTTDEKTDK